MSLTMQMHKARDVLIVRLCGELDHHTSAEVRDSIEKELANEHPNTLLLNLADLEFMDSSGLGVILGRYKYISQYGGKLILCAVKPAVHRVMEMAGMFKILPTYDDEESALSACEVVL